MDFASTDPLLRRLRAASHMKMIPPRRPRRELSLRIFVMAKRMLETIQEHEELAMEQQNLQDVSQQESTFSIPAQASVLASDTSSSSNRRSIIYTTINSSIITIAIERVIQQSKSHVYALLST
ncbi:hypothetical protein K492DRAFT_182638 [Lichtheimia hyalospora FSU 10163]|nr:hypothetical protein K492DRAFT_182638 [Lichtheimia hyalospora FSU 10163]